MEIHGLVLPGGPRDIVRGQLVSVQADLQGVVFFSDEVGSMPYVFRVCVRFIELVYVSTTTKCGHRICSALPNDLRVAPALRLCIGLQEKAFHQKLWNVTSYL